MDDFGLRRFTPIDRPVGANNLKNLRLLQKVESDNTLSATLFWVGLCTGLGILLHPINAILWCSRYRRNRKKFDDSGGLEVPENCCCWGSEVYGPLCIGFAILEVVGVILMSN